MTHILITLDLKLVWIRRSLYVEYDFFLCVLYKVLIYLERIESCLIDILNNAMYIFILTELCYTWNMVLNSFSLATVWCALTSPSVSENFCHWSFC